MPVDPQPPASVYLPASLDVPAARSSESVPNRPAAQVPSQPKFIHQNKDTADIAHEVSPSEFVVSYHFSEPGRHLYFQVIDASTGRVLRQVPPEAVLNDERRVAEYLELQTKLQQQELVKK